MSKSVLLLGSGMCSHPIIAYLDKHGFQVYVGSRSKRDDKLRDTEKATWVEIDIETPAGEKAMDEYSPKVDVIISLLPYAFHPKAAKYALKYKKHFLTASYVSDGIRALTKDFEDAGLVCLNELGVDPGTDHMALMPIIERVHRQGGKISYFTSYAGGLPAQECDDNPFHYKFSWAPKGVLLAGKNSARFYENGEDRTVSGQDLFLSYKKFEIEGFDEFEVYPNRDSTPYRDIYGIPECATVIRGTLRIKGWCEKIKKLVDLGYVEETARSDLAGKSYAQLTGELAGADGNVATLADQVASKLRLTKDSHVIAAFRWLGLFDEAEKIPSGVTNVLDALSLLMRKKMTLQSHERDLMLLRHTIIADFPDRREHITSTLIDYGFPNGDTSMSRTTSLPLAIAARMVLEGRYAVPGVAIPITPNLYEPIMAELAELNISYDEQTRVEKKRHLWLRDEVKPGERRAAITPVVAKKLIDEGQFFITVEKSTTRCYPDSDYVSAGCVMAEAGSWPKAPADAIIVGLKELPADGSALTHAHVFFCHAFKNQAGWQEELARFTRGGGSLYDMEYLTFPNGRRVAAFGRAAGLAGAAVAAKAWALKQDGKTMGTLSAWNNQLHMIADVKGSLGDRTPTALVLGALGRSGRGAVDVLEALGCKVTKWDMAETSKGGPFPELLQHDIVVNCILLLEKIPQFITNEMIASPGKMSVICDVSCDTSNPENPLPFLNKGTTLDAPILEINDKVWGITIDHLPTLVPVESSEGFSNDLLPHFLTIPSGAVWSKALKIFQEKSAQK